MEADLLQDIAETDVPEEKTAHGKTLVVQGAQQSADYASVTVRDIDPRVRTADEHFLIQVSIRGDAFIRQVGLAGPHLAPK